ncbi:MAG: non-canonical purine NTP pyrophosphatase, RdgB/HAM1 family [Syntrophus sp. (in: bacteria)]|nr:non-canonical purine NTP pyrophosphatase, RdgB/HAM1 family [Syntrophus sp. (in: bacteria)]
MRQIVIATSNTGKFKEIRDVLADAFDRFYSLNDFDEKVLVEEDSPLYVENVIKKARKIGDRFGIETIADDSGLEVEALGGRPGVLSARYGDTDDERIARLLSELEGVEWKKRGAVFKAYLAFYIPEREVSYVFYGALSGYITFEKRGDQGFGYDPVFYVPEYDKAFAELTMEVKNSISHRGRALHAFSKFLNAVKK